MRSWAEVGELSWHSVPFLCIDRWRFSCCKIWPIGRIFPIKPQPVGNPWLGIRFDRLGRAFGLAHSAIDTFVRVNDKHVFAGIEAVDRTDFHAIHILAFDAVFGDYVGQGTTLRSALGTGRPAGTNVACELPIWLPKRPNAQPLIAGDRSRMKIYCFWV